MLSRPGPIPAGPKWSFEVKWDGFRAIVSTAGDFLRALDDAPDGLLELRATLLPQHTWRQRQGL